MKKKSKKISLSPEFYDRHERLQSALRRRLDTLAKRGDEPSRRSS